MYVVLRSAFAVAHAATLWRMGQAYRELLAQALADVFGALMVIGYFNASVRGVIDGWWALMFLYVVAWEVRQGLRWRDEDISECAGSGDALWFVWEIFAVAPAAFLGFLLFFDVLFPNQWSFPSSLGIRSS